MPIQQAPMIVYIHLQPADYIVDPVYAMAALMRVYNLQGMYTNVTPPDYPDGESLYKYTPSVHDGLHLQNFIDWISTRKYCKDVSVE